MIEARLTTLERDLTLYDKDQFAARAAALDVVLQVYQFLQLHQRNAAWGRYRRGLEHQAKRLEKCLRAVDAAYFQTLRSQIRTRKQTPETLRALFNRHTPYRAGRVGQSHRGYDALDALVQGLFRSDEAPAPTQCLEADMVHYEPAPARAILDLSDQVPMSHEDVFYDLGSGLGHVPLLVYLLTGVTARGVEIDAVYCQHAQRCAAELDLASVDFLHADARDADYTEGTVFFMYTPFTGDVMATVLTALQRQAHHRPLTICTHGACTFEVAAQPWLHPSHPETTRAHTLAVFNSL